MLSTDLVVSMRTPEVISGEKYITKAAFKGEFEEDISFPEKATIEVIEKSISGWWMVRSVCSGSKQRS